MADSRTTGVVRIVIDHSIKEPEVRRFITGVDPSGHSCLVEESPVSPEEGFPGFASSLLATIHSAPPPPRPPGRGEFVDLGVAPGHVHWLLVEYGAGAAFPMHHTDSVDLDLVLEGTMELGLDDGIHSLESGDIVVMNGVDHSWRAGPLGCRLVVVAIGTPPLTTPSV